MNNLPLEPPVDTLFQTLMTAGGLENVLALPAYQDFSPDIIRAILEEAGKFAAGQLAPLNATGDANPARLEGDSVIMPEGFSEAYKQFVAGGWNTLPSPQAYGGQGLPAIVHTAISELWNQANMGFALCPMLTQAAVSLIEHHGSEELKGRYLPKLVEGVWTGTMCLTEPQAGSDVGALNTRAEATDNGTYRITGTKIFITYGEHELAENIIHMVLARLPGAPEGTRGISLFLVPKYIPEADGTPGRRNDLRCVSLEEKMGIHASPTCVMSFGDNGGATGYLIGEEHGGIKAMFTMMNEARLQVGVEGIGIAERARQLAVTYAAERVQGGRSIDHYPDVKRMLYKLEAHATGLRAMGLYAAQQMDIASHAPDETEKQHAQQRLDLLIPIVKSYATETGFLMASEAMQVYGGMGYIEESGIPQLLRDSRIAMIYEGTNGIQAMDLLRRKLPVQEGAGVYALLEDIASWSADTSAACQSCRALLPRLLQSDNTEKTASVAHDILFLLAILLENGLLARIADAEPTKKVLHSFHSSYLLPQHNTYIARITHIL